jgi:PadR family transcriptional regulator PadR
MDALARLTPATADVLDALLSEATPLWGLLIVKRTGRPAGSVYPILERLERSEWVVSAWEPDSARSGPRRRLYELTPDGAVAAAAAVSRVRARETASASRPGAASARLARVVAALRTDGSEQRMRVAAAPGRWPDARAGRVRIAEEGAGA